MFEALPNPPLTADTVAASTQECTVLKEVYAAIQEGKVQKLKGVPQWESLRQVFDDGLQDSKETDDVPYGSVGGSRLVHPGGSLCWLEGLRRRRGGVLQARALGPAVRQGLLQGGCVGT
ncbi:hypothetical protein MTO96_025202 [Rhipicephalus appendiculatus]